MAETTASCDHPVGAPGLPVQAPPSKPSTKILENRKSSKIIIVVTISLILLVNLGYSYVTLEVITTENSVHTVIENLNSPFSEKINPNKYDLDNIAVILGSQHDIENSYVMSTYLHFAEIVGAKTEAVLFTEGPEGDSIDNYITRKNNMDYMFFKVIEDMKEKATYIYANKDIVYDKFRKRGVNNSLAEKYLFFAFPGKAEKCAEIMRIKSGIADYYGSIYFYDMFLEKFWTQGVCKGEWDTGWIEMGGSSRYIADYFEKSIPVEIQKMYE